MRCPQEVLEGPPLISNNKVAFFCATHKSSNQGHSKIECGLLFGRVPRHAECGVLLVIHGLLLRLCPTHTPSSLRTVVAFLGYLQVSSASCQLSIFISWPAAQALLLSLSPFQIPPLPAFPHPVLWSQNLFIFASLPPCFSLFCHYPLYLA